MCWGVIGHEDVRLLRVRERNISQNEETPTPLGSP